MIKGIFAFLVIYAILYVGISVFRSLTNRENKARMYYLRKEEQSFF